MIQEADLSDLVVSQTVPSGLMREDGTCSGVLSKTGYYYTSVNGKRYRTHRIIYFIVNKELPALVDHKDGDKTNNNPGNLRSATKSQNGHNVGLRNTNTSGIKGLMFNKRANSWYGQITHNYQRYHTPLTKNKELCISQIKELRETLHGDFKKD